MKNVRNFPKKRSLSVILLFKIVCLVLVSPVSGNTSVPRIAYSKDGTPITFNSFGKGEWALVLIHGWSCDSRYWSMQVPKFSKNYRVITLDLAGHGNSGLRRRVYTMEAYAEDVKAVVDATGVKKVIVVGHSMGGPVAARAARLMPKRVKGLIGVDTLENIEAPMTQEGIDALVAPFKQDFDEAARTFAEALLRPAENSARSDWIKEDMASAIPEVGIQSLANMMSQHLTGESYKVFDGLQVPVITIDGDLGIWPLNIEANKRHMKSFETFSIADGDHFLMFTKHEAFNTVFQDAIKKLTDK